MQLKEGYDIDVDPNTKASETVPLILNAWSMDEKDVKIHQDRGSWKAFFRLVHIRGLLIICFGLQEITETLISTYFLKNTIPLFSFSFWIHW